VPNLEQMELKKEGFGVGVNIEYFKRKFVLDDDQEIKFDNPDAERFWNLVIAGHKRNLESSGNT
jgi:hypothetical protein